MKFLALTLLLAVGSQAASLQADAPSDLESAGQAFNMYLDNFQAAAKKVLGQVNQPELSDQMITFLDTGINAMRSAHGSAFPVLKGVVSTVDEATGSLRASIQADLDSLKAELEPKRVQLKDIVDKHMAEYHTLLDPIIEDYQARHTAEMESLRVKLEPVLSDLRQKMGVNIEETKSVLLPMLETVRAKANERLEGIKEIVRPYVEEYKTQMKQAYDQAKSLTSEDLTALREKIAPSAEIIRENLQIIFEAIASTYNKS